MPAAQSNRGLYSAARRTNLGGVSADLRRSLRLVREGSLPVFGGRRPPWAVGPFVCLAADGYIGRGTSSPPAPPGPLGPSGPKGPST